MYTKIMLSAKAHLTELFDNMGRKKNSKTVEEYVSAVTRLINKVWNPWGVFFLQRYIDPYG